MSSPGRGRSVEFIEPSVAGDDDAPPRVVSVGLDVQIRLQETDPVDTANAYLLVQVVDDPGGDLSSRGGLRALLS